MINFIFSPEEVDYQSLSDNFSFDLTLSKVHFCPGVQNFSQEFLQDC